jgi:hypothetical protein
VTTEATAMWLETLEQRQVILPPLQRRIIILVCAGLLGVFVAHLFAPLVRFGNGELVISLLALMAGVSALWSP